MYQSVQPTLLSREVSNSFLFSQIQHRYGYYWVGYTNQFNPKHYRHGHYWVACTNQFNPTLLLSWLHQPVPKTLSTWTLLSCMHQPVQPDTIKLSTPISSTQKCLWRGIGAWNNCFIWLCLPGFEFETSGFDMHAPTNLNPKACWWKEMNNSFILQQTLV
jgi:hypothetical protein